MYSVIRSKSLFHMLFERGMVLSYDRILTFINELPETVKAFYNNSRGKCGHLPYVEEYSLYSSMTMLIKTAPLSLLLATSMRQELLSYSFLLKKIQVYNVSKKLLKNCKVSSKTFTTVNKIND